MVARDSFAPRRPLSYGVGCVKLKFPELAHPPPPVERILGALVVYVEYTTELVYTRLPVPSTTDPASFGVYALIST